MSAESSSTALTPEEVAGRDDLADWRYGVAAIHAEFALDGFPAGAALVAAIADAAEAANHHPEVHLRYPGVVRVDLSSHDVGGVTRRDAALALTISALAAEAGATPRPPEA